MFKMNEKRALTKVGSCSGRWSLPKDSEARDGMKTDILQSEAGETIGGGGSREETSTVSKSVRLRRPAPRSNDGKGRVDCRGPAPEEMATAAEH